MAEKLNISIKLIWMNLCIPKPTIIIFFYGKEIFEPKLCNRKNKYQLSFCNKRSDLKNKNFQLGYYRLSSNIQCAVDGKTVNTASSNG